jgi:hypothetical protein
VIGETFIEVKLWSHFTGEQVLAAQKEFAKDLLYCIENNDLGFKKLKWVFSDNMVQYRSAIREMMENVIMQNPEVAKALAAKGIKDLSGMRDALRRAVDPSTGWLLEFF